MNAKLRGDRYWIHGTVGKKFFRYPLGTANKEAAHIIVEHAEQALAGGQTSIRWQELKKILPPKTFEKLAKIGSYREPKPEPEAPPVPTWADLDSVFRTKMQQRIQLGKLAESTFERYEQTLRTFKAFLDEQGIHDLPVMKGPSSNSTKSGVSPRFRKRSLRVAGAVSRSTWGFMDSTEGGLEKITSTILTQSPAKPGRVQ